MDWRISHGRVTIAISSVLAIGCTSVQTSLVGPTGGAGKCQVSAAGAPLAFGHSGGTGNLSVTTSRDCTWTIAGEPAWVSIKGNRNGQGEAVVPYAVAPNPVPSPRVGSFEISGQLIQLHQAAVPCRFDLSRSRDHVGPAGGQLAVDVATLTGCSWSAKAAVPWISILSGQSAAASATVRLHVAANNGVDRLGTMSIAGETYTVSQSGLKSGTPTDPTPPSPPPTDPTPPPTSPTIVQFEGVSQDVRGKCPNVTFRVSGRTVATSRETDYKDMSCKDLEQRERRVRVTGVQRANGTVDATQIARVREDDDDDDDD